MKATLWFAIGILCVSMAACNSDSATGMGPEGPPLPQDPSLGGLWFARIVGTADLCNQTLPPRVNMEIDIEHVGDHVSFRTASDGSELFSGTLTPDGILNLQHDSMTGTSLFMGQVAPEDDQIMGVEQQRIFRVEASVS